MKNTILILFVVSLLTACTQSTPTITPNKESILRTGKWKVSSGTVTLKKPNGIDTTLNYMPFIPPCHTDDYFKFDSTNHGATFPGANICSAAEPDSISFNWRLLNNDNNIDLLNIFNFFYLVVESIDIPYYFDTISHSPLVLDTLQNGPNPVLDTMWNLRFDSALVTGNPNVYPGVNIYNAGISNFSKSSFTLTFRWYSKYPDSTGGHEGGPPNYAPPIMRNDTLTYILTFTNF